MSLRCHVGGICTQAALVVTLLVAFRGRTVLNTQLQTFVRHRFCMACDIQWVE